MKRIITLFLVMTTAFALCGCGEGASDKAAGSAGMVNPVHEVTADELVSATGIMLAAPERAGELRYSYIDQDGGSPIAQLCFTLDGVACTYRALAAAELTDISGMYYQWSSDGTAEVGYCEAELHWIEGQQGIALWYDAAPGLLYSLSMDSGSTKDALTAVANELFAPVQGDSDAEGFQPQTVKDSGCLIADLDGDGAEDKVSILEWTVDEFGSKQYAFNVEGSSGLTVLWDEFYVDSKPVLWLADIDGDCLPEILFCGDSGSDDYFTVCCKWDGGTLSRIHLSTEDNGYADGCVEAVNGSVLTIGAFSYVLGTYGGRRDFALNGDGVIAPLDNSIWSFEGNEMWLTTARELPVTFECIGSLLPTGTDIRLTGFNGVDVVYFVTAEGAEGSIFLTKNESYWGWLIDGVEETEYFVTLPYAG